MLQFKFSFKMGGINPQGCLYIIQGGVKNKGHTHINRHHMNTIDYKRNKTRETSSGQKGRQR